MLSDDILSSYAFRLQRKEAKRGNHSVLLFPVETIKLYAGLYHTERNYHLVNMITKEFQNGFNICARLIEKDKLLLFPIIRGMHFYLVCIRVCRS